MRESLSKGEMSKKVQELEGQGKWTGEACPITIVTAIVVDPRSGCCRGKGNEIGAGERGGSRKERG